MSLLITISGATPLVLSGSDDANPIGVTNYSDPAMQSRVRYAPTSEFVHGEQPLGWTLQQTILGFDIVTDLAGSEAASRSLIADVRAAITQFAFTVTVAVEDAPAEVWSCNPGSMSLTNPRSYYDLRDHNPVWSVTIPCYPIPAGA
jgi:hypothetical protein